MGTVAGRDRRGYGEVRQGTLHTVRAALFDFDGTLVRQRIDFRLMRHRVLEVLGNYGGDAEPLAGLHILEMIDRAYAALAAKDPLQAVRMRAAAYGAIEEIELRAAPEATPSEGAVDLLAGLRRAGIGVGIVTRNCLAAVERVLTHYHLEYDVLLTRDDVPHVKPDPRHLQAALDMLGVPGAQALMCGDHPMDIEAGRRVGTFTVAVLSAERSARDFAAVRPDLVVNCVGELIPLMGLDGG